jgi:hypothetical protein
MANDEPRKVNPGGLGDVVLTLDQAFDVLDALDAAAALADRWDDIDVGARMAIAQSVLRRAMGAE